jgi:hypothetical protein
MRLETEGYVQKRGAEVLLEFTRIYSNLLESTRIYSNLVEFTRMNWVASLRDDKVCDKGLDEGAGGRCQQAHGCSMCYVLHATKWVFLGKSRILGTRGGCSMCYMLQIGEKAERLKR